MEIRDYPDVDWANRPMSAQPTNSRPRSVMFNCDLGEGVPHLDANRESQLMSLIDSANIACGAHAGDRSTMERSMRLALEHNVEIGAHPGYPDRESFGRKPMRLSNVRLQSILEEQLAFLDQLADRLNAVVAFIKPHGALYHAACFETDVAEVMTQVALATGKVAMVGLPDCPLQDVCQRHGLAYRREGFADRRYLGNGKLVSRTEPDANLPTELAVQQVAELVEHRRVTSRDGDSLRLEVDTICIHGDSPDALPMLQAIRRRLK